MQNIDKKYIREFDLEDPVQFFKITEEKGSSTFKILKINSLTAKGALKFILKSFIEVFNQSTHLFLVVICVDDQNEITLEDIKPLEELILPQKPLIIQWESASASNRSIFYKQSYSSVFLLDDNWPISFTEEELERELATFKFSLLLKALYFNFGGLFNGNLLVSRLNATWELDSWQFIDYAAKSDDALSLRYLLLFQWDLVKQKEYGDRVLEIAAQYASPPSLRALLDLPANDTIEEILPVCEARRLLNLKNHLKLTPLSIAAKHGNIETLKLIINCGIEEDYGKVITEAWEHESYDVVLALLKAGAPFPIGFKLPKSLDNQHVAALANLVVERGEFHKAIMEESYETIENFVKCYPHLKQAQTETNQTALETALAAKRWGVFAFLVSKGYILGSTEEIQLELLAPTDTEKLNAARSQFSRTEDNSHITHLLSRVRCTQGNYMDRIKELLEDLNDMPYVSTILKVLEKSNIQDIFFDFNKKSIVDLDLSGTSTANGLCNFVTGTIYIGANQDRETLLGTIAHEFCHLAMQTVYKHMCNPYIELDEVLASRFKDIIELYRTKEHINPIIEKVFSVYRETSWPSELIVRVPHIVASHYGQVRKIRDIRNRRGVAAIELEPAVICKAPELFEFYHQKIQNDFTEYISNSEHFETQHLNIALKHVSKILESNIRISNGLGLDENILLENVVIVSSSTPELVKIDLFQIFKRKYLCIPSILSQCVFVTLDDLKTEHYTLWISKCFKSNYKHTLVVDCSPSSLDEQTLYNEVCWFAKQRQARIIFITNERQVNDLHKTICNLFNPEKITEPFLKEYVFSDLTIESREKLLEQLTIDFQSHSIALSKLVSANSVNIESLPLTELLLEETVSIGESLTVPYSVSETYIERTLQVEYDTTKGSFGETEFLSKFYNEEVVLLIGEAGSGKSTVLAHLSEQFKKLHTDHWVMKINLLEHRKSLKKIKETREAIENPIEYISDTFLRLKRSFEKKMFDELLKQKKLVIMLDGFDEISPTYAGVVIELLKILKKLVIGQLWLTSRNYHERLLREELEPLLCKLQPFSEEDVICSLKKNWSQNMNLSENEIDTKNITIFTRQLLNSLPNSISNTKDAFIGIPLNVYMLAEIFEEKARIHVQNDENYQLSCELDLLDVYSQFTRIKFKIYLEEKSKSSASNIDIYKHNLKEVHEQLAIQYLYPEEVERMVSVSKFEKPNILPDEELDRIGLTLHSSGLLAFTHRTFAEYFAASFFVRKILTSDSQFIFDFFIERIICNIENDITRMFIDSFLELWDQEIASAKYKWYGARIANFWKANEKRLKLLYPRNYRLTLLMLNSLVAGNDKALIENIFYHRGFFLANEFYYFGVLQNKRWFCETPWFEAAINGNMNTLKLLWDKYKVLERSKLINLLACRSYNWDSVFFISIQGNKMELFDLLVTFVKDICLTKEEFKEMFLFWTRFWWCRDTSTLTRYLSSFGGPGQSWVFGKIGNVVEDLKFTPADYEELLERVCTYTYQCHVDFAIVQYGVIWHMAAYTGNINILEELVKWISKTGLKTTDLVEILNAKAWKGETIWHCALNKVSLSGRWEYLSKWVIRGTANSQEVAMKLYAWFYSLGVDTDTLNKMLSDIIGDEYLHTSSQALEYAETCDVCHCLVENRKKSALKKRKTYRKIKWSMY